MAKKSSGRVSSLLSPENYIRQKVRQLPIYECWLNRDWEKTRLANILVSRRHSNKNLTFAVFLVDLYCLGVKDSFFAFNMSETRYRDILQDYRMTKVLDAISYSFAHNIIFAGVAYAESIGISPCPDFSRVSQYLLEEDTEEIEFMDIICGFSGMPAYFRGPLDDDAKAFRILSHLEKELGEGNFLYAGVRPE